MEQVTPTRMELLAKKTQIALAEQGRELLNEKRAALMREFMKIADRVMRSSDELEQASGDARHALALAEAIDGREAVHSASFAAQGEVSLRVEVSNVMGVSIPAIEQRSVTRSALDRGYSLAGSSTRIDRVAERFEEEVNLVIELANSELRLRRLAEEIQKTSRRVNALDNVLIPRLVAQRDYIQMVLDERERESVFRLKRVKQALEKRGRGQVE
jgi:V/A-type H+-transporting ATPase subunit D